MSFQRPNQCHVYLRILKKIILFIHRVKPKLRQKENVYKQTTKIGLSLVAEARFLYIVDNKKNEVGQIKI